MLRRTLLFAAPITLAGCGRVFRYFTTGPVSKRIGNEVRSKGVTRIAISELTKFDWDELLLFGPYMPKTEICDALRVPRSDCETVISAESADDADMTLGFRLKGKLVHYELHARWHGDFIPFPATQPIARNKALFNVIADGQATDGSVWYKLVQLEA
jgi:hypothetical protein